MQSKNHKQNTRETKKYNVNVMILIFVDEKTKPNSHNPIDVYKSILMLTLRSILNWVKWARNIDNGVNSAVAKVS